MRSSTLGLLVGTMLSGFLHAQTIYVYPLSQNFLPDQAGGPALIQIPNNQGLTGEFVTRNVPESTCGQAGTAGGYFFEDDAGLQFNNPQGFIGEEYSLAFNFQIDEFIYPPSWVRILSFTHIDDVGVYIYLTSPPYHGTLEFWPYGTVGEEDFFSPDEFYQLILVRHISGMINIYVNGQEFAEYDDSQTMKYLPQDPDNFIVFFRDHPSVLANEASPGFVSAFRITKTAWTPAEVQQIWEEFCATLLSVPDAPQGLFSLSPNPASETLRIRTNSPAGMVYYSVADLTGKCLLTGITGGSDTELDISALGSGLYFIRLESGTQAWTGRFVKK